jgi:hypothetical protein
LQWLKNKKEINMDNFKNAIHASRHFKENIREYLRDKINEVAVNSNNNYIRDLYRGINEFKNGYQYRNNLI